MIHYEGHGVTLWHGDSLDVLAELDACSVDAVVTDPPYELTAGKRGGTGVASVNLDSPYGRSRIGTGNGSGGFMGKAWDATGIAFDPDFWRAVLRVLKPGGHLLAFGGTRTWHRLACAIEDAGFEIRDNLAWMYGSGFPKSLDVSKAIDRAAGAERAKVRHASAATAYSSNAGNHRPWMDEAAELGYRAVDGDTPATPDAARWQGWGTALKPSHEPVVWAVKPHTITALLATIGSQLDALEEACRQRASDAARSSGPTRPDSPEAKTASAPESAATQREGEPATLTQTGEAVDSSAVTATSASAWTAETLWSIVTSWKACWVEICDLTSTFTTSTATSRTTDLRTLSSCLSLLMQSVTAQSTPEPRSWSSLVTAADNLFAAGVLSSRSTLALSAVESATASTPHNSRGAVDLRPAYEPIVLARKPLAGTVAGNVLAHGTGALNVDGCRIGTTVETWPATRSYAPGQMQPGHVGDTQPTGEAPAGRWPANVVLDDTAATILDEQSGQSSSGSGSGSGSGGIWSPSTGAPAGPQHGDSGGASRFFYTAKADATERPRVDGVAHPTVKPLDLMRWLVRLVTPPGGIVLDPFAGSGTTVEACLLEGFQCVAVEREADYLPLIVARITRRRDPVAWQALAGDGEPTLFDGLLA